GDARPAPARHSDTWGRWHGGAEAPARVARPGVGALGERLRPLAGPAPDREAAAGGGQGRAVEAPQGPAARALAPGGVARPPCAAPVGQHARWRPWVRPRPGSARAAHGTSRAREAHRGAGRHTPTVLGPRRSLIG